MGGEGLRRYSGSSDLQRRSAAPDDLNVCWHQVVQVAGVTLLATDCCHGNRWSCSVALNGDSDVTRDFRGDGDVALVGSWRWGNETARHGRLQDSLHLSLGEDSRLTLREVDRGGGHGHRRTGLDRDGLGGGLWLAKRLHLWVGSDHHGLLLVISERRWSPSASSCWRVILLAVFSIAAAVGFSTILCAGRLIDRNEVSSCDGSGRDLRCPSAGGGHSVSGKLLGAHVSNL